MWDFNAYQHPSVTFVYAATKRESITAASELMPTPAAITSQVKLLEENIGLKLRKHSVPFQY
jgi:hypothetical protein